MNNINSKKTPLYRNTSFYLINNQTTKKAFEQELEHPHEPEHYIYSKYRNPTIVETEKHIAKIEESDWLLLAPSGMAAIDTALSVFQHKGENK